MSAVREYQRSIEKPFFLKKKFLLIYALVVLVVLLIGLLLTWLEYQWFVDTGQPILWEKITRPLMLPTAVALFYVVIVMIWFALKVKGFQAAALDSMHDITHPQHVGLKESEEKFSEVEVTGRKSPKESERFGVFRLTNQRITHTQTRSVKRMRVLFGMDEPDLTWSMPLNKIRQCGFGLDEKNPIRFVVTENDGTVHTFVSVYARHLEKAMSTMGWKRMQIDEHVYWIR